VKKPDLMVVGAKGRMGQAVCLLAESSGFNLVAAVDIGGDLPGGVEQADVVIEFSAPQVSPQLSGICRAQKKPLVIGTTGHDEMQRAQIHEAAKDIPIVLAPNFSIGVNTLFWLVRKATQILGPAFDLEIVEAHHNKKKDSPSGTARRLAEILCEARQLEYAAHVRHGREGLVGERSKVEIGMHAVRGGDVVGDHTVFYLGQGERLELTHRASSRDTFALGALRSAHWVIGREPGIYSMEDVLGLK